MPGRRPRVLVAAIAAAATFGARAGLDAAVHPSLRDRAHPSLRDPAHPSLRDAARWTRTNHRGDAVSLLEGPATAAGLLVGAAICGARGSAACDTSRRVALGAAVATAGAAAFGLVDDLTEDEESRTKGLRGHLGALARGQLTTGGLKVLGIGACALVAAALVTPARAPAGRSCGRAAFLADVAASGALIAATANLVNLLDLRPGRALKAAGLAAVPFALAGGPGAPLAAGVVGAAAGSLRADLAERDMLGDGGANALGALLGTAVAVSAPRPLRNLLLAGAVALTLASERVSFTKVIATTPELRELDAWGRRAAEVVPE